MCYVSDSVMQFMYLTESSYHVQYYLHFKDEEIEDLFMSFGQGHTNCVWSAQHSNQGLCESKAHSSYYVWMVSWPACE